MSGGRNVRAGVTSTFFVRSHFNGGVAFKIGRGGRSNSRAPEGAEVGGRSPNLCIVSFYGIPGSSVENCGVVNWKSFTPSDFEYDFDQDKLATHRVDLEEAMECFFSDFEVRRNKKYLDRYQLIGRTIAGRSLKVVFQIKPGNVVRIIAG